MPICALARAVPVDVDHRPAGREIDPILAMRLAWRHFRMDRGEAAAGRRRTAGRAALAPQLLLDRGQGDDRPGAVADRLAQSLPPPCCAGALAASSRSSISRQSWALRCGGAVSRSSSPSRAIEEEAQRGLPLERKAGRDLVVGRIAARDLAAVTLV